MNHAFARAGILIGMLMIVPGVPLLVFGTPGTPEYAITLFTVLIGAVFVVAISVAVRISQR